MIHKIIDVHAHILPGVDDGARDMEMSLGMLKKAREEGIGGIILTPHHRAGRHNPGPERIRQKIKELKERAKEEGIETELYAGNEIYYGSAALEELEEGSALSLGGSRYVLIEFSPLEEYRWIREGLYRLLTGGYVPVLAHGERYACLQEKPERGRELKELGSLIQINAGSIAGGILGGTAGREKRTARLLVKEGAADLFGTDAHDMGRRSPKMKGCAAYLRSRKGEEEAERLLHGTAARILKDEEI